MEKVNGKDVEEVEVSPASDRAASLVHIGRKFLPHVGSAGVLFFSTNVASPRLWKRLFPANDGLITNLVWFGAHIGTGYYIYSRQHMQSIAPAWRSVYAASGAILFNFGTVLLWGIAKAIMPKNDVLSISFGLVSGAALLYTGHQYLNFVDSLAGSTTDVKSLP